MFCDQLEPEIQSKLLFDFTKIPTPAQLEDARNEVLESFRKRNNPSEEDELELMDDDSLDKVVVVSVFDNSAFKNQNSPAIQSPKQ